MDSRVVVVAAAEEEGLDPSLVECFVQNGRVSEFPLLFHDEYEVFQADALDFGPVDLEDSLNGLEKKERNENKDGAAAEVFNLLFSYWI